MKQIHKRSLQILGGAMLSALALSVSAAVSPEEAAKLQTTLTPMGAERAGNTSGTIPAWTGGTLTAAWPSTRRR